MRNLEKFKNVEMTYLFSQRIIIENRKNERIDRGCRGGMGMGVGVRSEGWMDGGSGLLGALSMMSVTALCTYKKEKGNKISETQLINIEVYYANL